ncbi:hypothetical protein Sjap_007651 [Stephania japonica]|uniref:Uncharacterized protein n=1 Tax=Stephania japonica TaxID=461633 RepID=A0AAP0JQD4_9MAGN
MYFINVSAHNEFVTVTPLCSICIINNNKNRGNHVDRITLMGFAAGLVALN